MPDRELTPENAGELLFGKPQAEDAGPEQLAAPRQGEQEAEEPRLPPRDKPFADYTPQESAAWAAKYDALIAERREADRRASLTQEQRLAEAVDRFEAAGMIEAASIAAAELKMVRRVPPMGPVPPASN